MKHRAIAIAALALTVALGMTAQTPSIDFKPVSCIRAGELAVLQMNVTGEGELRTYFRRINTTDWCSVEGTNDGPLSRVVLPKFDAGDEIEYFNVLIQGRQVVSRSPRIYRARVTLECQAPFARHIIRMSMSCGEEPGGVPMNMSSTLLENVSSPATPDSPLQQ